MVSDPRDRCTHDAEALRRSGLLDVPATDLPDGAKPPLRVGDKGYIGLGMITPKRKSANLPLHPDDKTYNRAVNQIRYKIERVIANTQDLARPAHRLQKWTEHRCGPAGGTRRSTATSPASYNDDRARVRPTAMATERIATANRAQIPLSTSRGRMMLADIEVAS